MSLLSTAIEQGLSPDIIDDTDPNDIYIGYIKYNAATSPNFWLIKRVELIGGISTIKYVSGKFDFVWNWTSRKTYEYRYRYFRSAAEEEDLYSYGVLLDTQISAPAISRTGNASLHRSLPIQSVIKACLMLDNGTVNYYLDAKDWTKKLDNSASNRSGTDGQVMIELPSYYIKFETIGTLRKVKISTYNLPGFTYVPKKYIAAYEGSVQRSTLKLCSVVNVAADYRGGNNNADWDAASNTLLGRPATALSRIDFKTYARNRGLANWNMITYEAYKSLFWLYTIEFASLNTQAAINAALDGNGFRQGGLDNGVTNIDGTKWNAWNTYYPFIPCGYSDSLASDTGAVAFTMPFAYDGGAAYRGDWNAATAYALNDFVSSGALLYKCIQANTGYAVTNTSYYTAQTRSVTNVNRYRGIEMPFGHIWKWTDGINIRIQANSAGALSQMYTCTDPVLFSNVGYTGYTLRGNLSRADGYIKEMVFGANGDILPTLVGGASTTWWCDYFFTSLPVSGESIRGVLFGGAADFGGPAGLGSSTTVGAPSYTYARVGSRLCFLGT
jgi:hypothetical protein